MCRDAGVGLPKRMTFFEALAGRTALELASSIGRTESAVRSRAYSLRVLLQPINTAVTCILRGDGEALFCVKNPSPCCTPRRLGTFRSAASRRRLQSCGCRSTNGQSAFLCDLSFDCGIRPLNPYCGPELRRTCLVGCRRPNPDRDRAP